MSKSKEIINPEIKREKEEAAKADWLDDFGEMRLFPYALIGSVASSNEATGLMQQVPITPDALEAYLDLYDYRKIEPTENTQ